MPDPLLDSSIVIDATNEQLDAVSYVNDLLTAGSARIHAATFSEVVVGTRNSRELFRLKRFLRPFVVEYPAPQDWAVALEYLGRIHLSHNVDLPDCLIAATAMRLRLPVATVNDRHFRLFKGLLIIRPY